MIPGVTFAYLEVLKFLEGLGPRHTTSTAISVSFRGTTKSPNWVNVISFGVAVFFFLFFFFTPPWMGTLAGSDFGGG